MSLNQTNSYDFHPAVGEWYGATQCGTDDVEQIKRLIGGRKGLRILEPFCGTGRILLPLALDGHTVTGLDQAPALLERARLNASRLPLDASQRVSLIEGDAVAGNWPDDQDLVILAGNCFYELATPEEQEGCIASAAAALKPGGYLYYDSDHMEGELAESWRTGAKKEKSGPISDWVAADGTKLRWSCETIWCDVSARLWRARRSTTITAPDGTVTIREYVQQKHPVSTWEVRGWIEKHGFEIERNYGDNNDSPYDDGLNRAVFWARKA